MLLLSAEREHFFQTQFLSFFIPLPPVTLGNHADSHPPESSFRNGQSGPAPSRTHQQPWHKAPGRRGALGISRGFGAFGSVSTNTVSSLLETSLTDQQDKSSCSTLTRGSEGTGPGSRVPPAQRRRRRGGGVRGGAWQGAGGSEERRGSRLVDNAVGGGPGGGGRGLNPPQ